MIERVIEDWLDSVSEKAFEVPFAQLLSLEGFTVVHMARPHGPMEQGKDILAFAKDTTPFAFQLKAGDLTLKNWRDPNQPLKGQVEDLLDLPIQHPSFQHATEHQSVLVTTGVLDDTLRQEIDQFNEGRKAKGKSILKVWLKGHIQQQILSSLSAFIPSKLPNFRDFLQLLLVDGTGVPDKEKLSMFLRERRPLKIKKASDNAIRATCAELVILSTHLVAPYQSVDNFISEIEVWTMVASQLMIIACSSKKSSQIAVDSLALIEIAIWKALQGLSQEILERESYIEGNPWADACVYQARITHVAGFLGAAVLWERLFGEEVNAVGALKKFCDNNQKQMFLWGEGAVPSFLALGWALDTISPGLDMELFLFRIIGHIISQFNKNVSAEKEKGGGAASASSTVSVLSDPYITITQILNRGIGGSASPIESSNAGQSYVLESLVKILVNRLFRVHLTSLWGGIAQTAFETYYPTSNVSLWNWNNGKEGSIESRYTPSPTSWMKLLEETRHPNMELLPPLPFQGPHFLLMMLLSMPHRINPSIVLALEQSDWCGGKFLLNSPKCSI
jgi:hypothetical protein